MQLLHMLLLVQDAATGFGRHFFWGGSRDTPQAQRLAVVPDAQLWRAGFSFSILKKKY